MIEDAGEFDHEARVARMVDEASFEGRLRFVPAVKLPEREAAIQLQASGFVGGFGNGLNDGVPLPGVVELFYLGEFGGSGRERLGAGGSSADR